MWSDGTLIALDSKVSPQLVYCSCRGALGAGHVCDSALLVLVNAKAVERFVCLRHDTIRKGYMLRVSVLQSQPARWVQYMPQP